MQFTGESVCRDRPADLAPTWIVGLSGRLALPDTKAAALYEIYIKQQSYKARIYIPCPLNLPSSMEAIMWDAIFLCAGLAFFATAIGYTLICEKL